MAPVPILDERTHSFVPYDRLIAIVARGSVEMGEAQAMAMRCINATAGLIGPTVSILVPVASYASFTGKPHRFRHLRTRVVPYEEGDLRRRLDEEIRLLSAVRHYRLVGRDDAIRKARVWLADPEAHELAVMGHRGVGSTVFAESVLEALSTGSDVAAPGDRTPFPATAYHKCWTRDRSSELHGACALLSELLEARVGSPEGYAADWLASQNVSDANSACARALAWFRRLGLRVDLPDEVHPSTQSEAEEWVRDFFRHSKLVVMVDDWPLLDRASARLLRAAANAEGSEMRLIATHRLESSTSELSGQGAVASDGSRSHYSMSTGTGPEWRGSIRLSALKPTDLNKVVAALRQTGADRAVLAPATRISANRLVPADIKLLLLLRALCRENRHRAFDESLNLTDAATHGLAGDLPQLAVCALVDGWFGPNLLKQPGSEVGTSRSEAIYTSLHGAVGRDFWLDRAAAEWMEAMAKVGLFTRRIDSAHPFRFAQESFREQVLAHQQHLAPHQQANAARVAAIGLLNGGADLPPDEAVYYAGKLLQELRVPHAPASQILLRAGKQALHAGRPLAARAFGRGSVRVERDDRDELQAAVDCLSLKYEVWARSGVRPQVNEDAPEFLVFNPSSIMEFNADFDALIPPPEQTLEHQLLRHTTLAYLSETLDCMEEGKQAAGRAQAIIDALGVAAELHPSGATPAEVLGVDEARFRGYEQAIAGVTGRVLSKTGALMAWNGPDSKANPDAQYAVDALDRFHEIAYDGGADQHRELSKSYNQLGWALWRTGHRLKAQDCHRQALRRAELAYSGTTPDERDRHRELWARLGIAHTLSDSLGRTGAGRMARQILAATSLLGTTGLLDRRAGFNLLHLSGCLYFRYGADTQAARMFFTEALRVLADSGVRWESLGTRCCVHELALEEVHQERQAGLKPDTAGIIADILESLALAKALGALRERGSLLRLLARAYRLGGLLEEAKNASRQARIGLRASGARYEWSLATMEYGRALNEEDPEWITHRAKEPEVRVALVQCALFLANQRWTRAFDDLRHDFPGCLGPDGQRALSSFDEMEAGRVVRRQENMRSEATLCNTWNARIASLFRGSGRTVPSDLPLLMQLRAPSRATAEGSSRGPL